MTDGSDLPVIDLLLYADYESDVIEEAIQSIHAADYPADRLRLHVIIEPDDATTWMRLRGLSYSHAFGVYEVPEDYPGASERPRALNYAYLHTDAEIVGVIDPADLLVLPGLFRAVATAFRERECDFALTRLDLANRGDAWRDYLSRAGYGLWYEQVVPRLARRDRPLSLGRVSWFFHRPVLERAAEDRFERDGSPWSVGERLWLFEHDLNRPVPWDPDDDGADVELGRRLWESGCAFEYLDPLPTEPSRADHAGWLDRRGRSQHGRL